MQIPNYKDDEKYVKWHKTCAWNTGMKLQKRTTKHHVNPPVSETQSLK